MWCKNNHDKIHNPLDYAVLKVWCQFHKLRMVRDWSHLATMLQESISHGFNEKFWEWVQKLMKMTWNQAFLWMLFQIARASHKPLAISQQAHVTPCKILMNILGNSYGIMQNISHDATHGVIKAGLPGVSAAISSTEFSKSRNNNYQSNYPAIPATSPTNPASISAAIPATHCT